MRIDDKNIKGILRGIGSDDIKLITNSDEDYTVFKLRGTLKHPKLKIINTSSLNVCKDGDFILPSIDVLYLIDKIKTEK